MKAFHLSLWLTIAFVTFGLSAVRHVSRAQTPNPSDSTRARRTENAAEPSPTPPSKEEVTLNSDDVLRVETNLTNVFFTASDRHKRFVSNIKREDLRVLENGAPQQVFTFQQNIDLPCRLFHGVIDRANLALSPASAGLGRLPCSFPGAHAPGFMLSPAPQAGSFFFSEL